MSVDIHTPARPDAGPGCDRHPVCDQLCERLAKVLVGRAADSILDAGLDDVAAAVVVLPSWAWASPLIPVGRKSRARDGGTLRLPVRLSWDTGPVVLVACDSQVVTSWSACGLGRTGAADVVVSTRPSIASMAADEVAVLDGPIPSHVHGDVVDASAVRARLAELSCEGTQAWWDLLCELEPFVRQEVGSAAGKVVADVTGSTDVSVSLDPLSLEAITDRMMFGDDGRPGRVQSMLERAMRPDELARVEPVRWMRTTIARDAEEEVRRMIGDPQVGRKVRNLARQLGPDVVSDMDVFLAAYGERYPADRLSNQRAEVALAATVGPLVNPTHADFEVHHDDVDMELEVLARIESSRRSRRRGDVR